MWHLNSKEVIIKLWTLNFWLPSFSLYYFHIANNQGNKFYKDLILKLSKNMTKLPLIWLMYLTLQANFQIT